MGAHAAAALCQAVADFDPARGVPLGAFVYRRVLASAQTRYRQEWTYAARFGTPLDENGESCPVDDEVPSAGAGLLAQAVAELTTASAWLIEQIFWNDLAESELAQRLGVSQQTINKRKKAALQELRDELRGELRGCLRAP